MRFGENFVYLQMSGGLWIFTFLDLKTVENQKYMNYLFKNNNKINVPL